MYPGPNDTNWQVAKFQHREMIAIGLHQQFVANALAAALAPKIEPALGSATFWRQFGAILHRVGHRLHGGQAVTGPTIGGSAPIKRGAAA